MDEKLGIEHLEQGLVALAKLGKTVADVMEDGKITTGEYVKLSFQIPNGITFAKNIKPSIPEIKDLDADEAKRILLAIAEIVGVEED